MHLFSTKTQDIIKNNTGSFSNCIHQETAKLKEFENENLFCNDLNWTVGLELEGWFLDSDLKPQPLGPEMVRALNNQELSEELSQYIFEINLNPLSVKAKFLESFEENLQKLLNVCNKWAHTKGVKIITIGMLPNVPPTSFTQKTMTKNLRYHLLNDALLLKRNHIPWKIKIEGNDTFEYETQDICLEAATTSTQFHLKVPYTQIANIYNYSQLLSAPMVALGSNSQFFDNKSLWAETRIPFVQQTMSEKITDDLLNSSADRTLFGYQYVKKSILEIFEDNLNFTPLVPLLMENNSNPFHHLNIHNGTVWRWNRPVIGKDSSNKYHIRIEHRVQSAGTTPADITAQLAFYVGVLAYWQAQKLNPSSKISFDCVSTNFYLAAQYGLSAKIHWFNGQKISIRDLMLEHLLFEAKKGLKILNIPHHEISFYLDEVLFNRLKFGRSGAVWQKQKVVETSNIDEMLSLYLENQQSFKPLFMWK